MALPGRLVIDRDDRRGGDGTLEALLARHGPLPRTWVSLTAGGEHVWLALPAGAAIFGGNNKLGPGIDVKTGRGSYVVGPPSLHPLGVHYQWRADVHPARTALAVAPEWVVRLLTPTPPPPPSPFRPRGEDQERVADALRHVPADDRDIWWMIGAALKSDLGEAGRALWDQWSATSEKYDPSVQERTWRSFRRSGIGIGTIFHFAKGRGHAR